jgi:hypothetical protein
MLNSSTGTGIKLRITSFALLFVPILNELLQTRGVELAPEGVVSFIDAFFYVVFALIHTYAWIRSIGKKEEVNSESLQ